MDTKAVQLADWARQSILSLALDPEFGSLTAVQKFIAAEAHLSVSYVQKFTQGAKENPTVRTVDALIYAIKAAKRRAAA